MAPTYALEATLESAYKGKTVFVTGHTGFKGSWLCEWLLMLGAKVVGYATEPPSEPSLFGALGLSERVHKDKRADVRDYETLRSSLAQAQPDYVFHLAAQPLVRQSFADPVETIHTNVNGTLNVLEALRQLGKACTVVCITTDKVYRNEEWLYAYREHDPLGGFDPYSASKACADILTNSYQQSFFAASAMGAAAVNVATARGGNVIGGGDWAKDRIVPDCMRALAAGETIQVRNRHATRPWQHVLELLSGYLTLGAATQTAADAGDKERLAQLCSAYNFGPQLDSNRSVKVLVESILAEWPGNWQDFSEENAPHEAGKLNLTIDKAYHSLGWSPRWRFEETIAQTVAWYRTYYASEPSPESVQKLTRSQIEQYLSS